MSIDMTFFSQPDIQEYLLLKSVEAVAIHGSKSAFSISLIGH